MIWQVVWGQVVNFAELPAYGRERWPSAAAAAQRNFDAAAPDTAALADHLVKGLHRLFVAFQLLVAGTAVAFQIGEQRDNGAGALLDSLSSARC